MFAGHPPGVLRLCVAEAFERFSYYTMAAVLVLFLAGRPEDGGFGWPAADAIGYYGTYVGLLWLVPLAGGWVADRWLGTHRAVLLGALVIVAGQLLMASPALIPRIGAALSGVPIEQALIDADVPLGQWPLPPGTSERLATALAGLYGGQPVPGAHLRALDASYLATALAFPLGLVLLAVGVGLLKPNITVMLGHRYGADDPRRDRGFTLFYIAINAGGILAGVIAGSVAERVGWAYGFLLAAGAMAIGYVVLLTGQLAEGDVPRVAGRAVTPPAPGPAASQRIPRGPLLYVVALTLFATIFWGAFMQSGGVLNLFIHEHVDRDVLGFRVPSAWFVVLPPLCVVLIGPAFQRLLDTTAARYGSVDTIQRFVAGLVLAAIAFLVLAAVAASRPPTALLPVFWPVGIYIILSLGELALAPAGNAMASRYVPPAAAGRLMAIWFLTYAGGSVLSGLLGSLSERAGIVGSVTLTATLLLAAAALLFIVRVRLRALVATQAPQAPASGVDSSP